MRSSFAFVLVGVLGCTASSPSSDRNAPVSPSQGEPEAKLEAAPDAEPDAKPDAEPDAKPEVKAASISVQMIAATLADECGGGPNTPPKPVPKAQSKAKMDEAALDSGPAKMSKSKAKGRRAKRRCRQSSMQLAIAAPAGVQPAELAVKSVELSIESGAALGLLQARAPSVWSEADGYVPWNQKIEPEQDLSVSYALTEPDWSKVEDRRSQTYTVKAVISIAGDDRTLEQNVEVAMPTALPPGVKT